MGGRFAKQSSTGAAGVRPSETMGEWNQRTVWQYLVQYNNETEAAETAYLRDNMGTYWFLRRHGETQFIGQNRDGLKIVFDVQPMANAKSSFTLIGRTDHPPTYFDVEHPYVLIVCTVNTLTDMGRMFYGCSELVQEYAAAPDKRPMHVRQLMLGRDRPQK